MGKWGQDMALERVGVYPGTFDPITSGHMEVIRRSLRLVDKLVIGPATNIGKGPLFSLEERIDIINGTGTYVRSGTMLTFPDAPGGDGPYCVQGSSLHMIALDATMTKVVDDIVLTKQ